MVRAMTIRDDDTIRLRKIYDGGKAAYRSPRVYENPYHRDSFEYHVWRAGYAQDVRNFAQLRAEWTAIIRERTPR